jgi:TetR/AcrR family transcriptional repressor of bet genes
MAVTGNRWKFRRKGGTAQREAPMDAARQGMAKGGSQAAAVRANADRAGMAPGLSRHCFQSGRDWTRAACGGLMDRAMAALPRPRPALTVKLPASA